jgi:hypothetical protein
MKNNFARLTVVLGLVFLLFGFALFMVGDQLVVAVTQQLSSFSAGSLVLPSTATIGNTVTATGAGWPAYERGNIFILISTTGYGLWNFAADASGSWSSTFTIPSSTFDGTPIVSGNYNFYAYGWDHDIKSAYRVVTLYAVAGFDFAVSTGTSYINLNQGQSSSTSVTVTLTSGSTKQVILTTSGCPSNVNCAVTTDLGYPTFTSTLNINVYQSATPGTYGVIVQGQEVKSGGGGLIRTAQVLLVINAPPPPTPFDYSIYAYDAGTITAGQTAYATVNVQLISGTSQRVNIALSGCPASSSCSVVPNYGNPDYSAQVTIATTGSTTANTYMLSVTGTSTSAPTHTATFYLTVQAQPPPETFDFSLSNSGPITVNYPSQPSGSTTITVALIQGQTQSVSLAVNGAPSGVTCTKNPSSGSPTFTSTITCTASSSAVAGAYTITVTGNGGGRSQSTQFQLTVSTETFDFSVSPSPATLTVTRGQTITASVNVNLLSGITQTVTLSVGSSGCPPSGTCTLSPSSGSPGFTSTLTIATSTATPAGTYNLVVTGTGGSKLHQAQITITVTGTPPGCDVNQQIISVKEVDSHNPNGQTVDNPTGTYVFDPDFTLNAQLIQSNCQVTSIPVVFISWDDSYQQNPPQTPVTYIFQSTGSGTWTSGAIHKDPGTKWFLNIGVATSTGTYWGLHIFNLDFTQGQGTVQAFGVMVQELFPAWMRTLTQMVGAGFMVFGGVLVGLGGFVAKRP